MAVCLLGRLLSLPVGYETLMVFAKYPSSGAIGAETFKVYFMEELCV